MNKALIVLLCLQVACLESGQKRKAEEISSAPTIAEHAPELFFKYFDELLKSCKSFPELKLNIKNFENVHPQWKDVVESSYGARLILAQEERILEDIQEQIVAFCRRAPAEACYPMPDVTKIGIDGTVNNSFSDPLIAWVIRYTKKDLNQDQGYTLFKTLLDNNALVNVSNNKGDTPLILASWFGKTGMVDMLMSAGADVNQTNNFGTTALMSATEKGQKYIVETLLARGADKNKINHRNEKAYDISLRKFQETGKSVYDQIATMLSPKKKKY